MRPIDADALIDFLDVGHLRHPSELCFSEIDVANLLLHAPTLSPDDVRGVGEWIKLDAHKGMEQYKCSVCETPTYVPECMNNPMYGYCPNCGARMKGAEDGTTDNS